MNWFLIIVAIVMTVMLMIGSLYVLVYFQAEEDKNTAWAPKIAVVLGLTLACCVVLLLPMDVANRSTGSGLDMEGLYQAVYMIIAIMILGVLPYLIFYYEAENPEGRNYQCWTAVKYEALTVLISLTVVVIMWVFLGKADVPLTEYVFNSTESERSSAAAHGLLAGATRILVTHQTQFLPLADKVVLLEQGGDDERARAFAAAAGRSLSGVAVWPRLLLDDDDARIVQARGDMGEHIVQPLTTPLTTAPSGASLSTSWWTLLPMVAPTAHLTYSTPTITLTPNCNLAAALAMALTATL